MTDHHFSPLAEATFDGPRRLARLAQPVVFRGLAADWPAVKTWGFARLASQLPDSPVSLVVGNREKNSTRFMASTLRRYLESLENAGASADGAPYLKEFDLLEAAPHLRKDLRHAQLLPRRSLQSLRSWIGPAGAGTGLHRDRLDNLAVQIVGRKRWRLVRPGAVERLGAVSAKYDAWAALSSASATDLAQRGAAPDDFFSVDVGPGDVLHLPAGWWHDVSNLTPSLLFGVFYGPPAQVLAQWAGVGAYGLLHRSGWVARGNCTCHAAA
jgi:lysine-specific demethylase 8